MTGIQALERIAPSRPMRPGQVERREFEYTRHGTQCLIGNFEVTTGQVIAPTVQRTRTEGRCCTNGFGGVVNFGILERSARPVPPTHLP